MLTCARFLPLALSWFLLLALLPPPILWVPALCAPARPSPAPGAHSYRVLPC